jgi:hypothetical protein
MVFFWLGDTAWKLVHRLSRRDVDYYLQNRARNHFNVIQVTALAEHDGLTTPNAQGDMALHHTDPLQPNEVYFQHLDYIIRSAAAHGLYIGLLPTWGSYVRDGLFTPETAYHYGRWLGERYRNENTIIWILGGDVNPDTAQQIAIWRRMASGITDSSATKPLMTYHPAYTAGSSKWFHDDLWLTLNMIQSAHIAPDHPNWEAIWRDVQQIPAKPVLDGEPNYEDHPIGHDPSRGYFRDHDVRKQAYRAVFAGACGHTYGHHAVWQMYAPGRAGIAHPDRFWRDALDRPGAVQMAHLRHLIERHPCGPRSRACDLVISSDTDNSTHREATRADDGSYAYVYVPTNQTILVDMRRIPAKEVVASWYDPRTGGVSFIGHYHTCGVYHFTSPTPGPDWVLMLEALNHLS